MILFKFEFLKCKFEQILFYFSKLQFFNFSFSKIFKTEFFVFWVNWVKIRQSLWFRNFENEVKIEILKIILFKFEFLKCDLEQFLFYFSKFPF
jgi:hypothetical protein